MHGGTCRFTVSWNEPIWVPSEMSNVLDPVVQTWVAEASEPVQTPLPGAVSVSVAETAAPAPGVNAAEIPVQGPVVVTLSARLIAEPPASTRAPAMLRSTGLGVAEPTWKVQTVGPPPGPPPPVPVTLSSERGVAVKS